MGGNALRKYGVTTKRLPSNEYDAFWFQLHGELSLCFSEEVSNLGLVFTRTKALGFKKDHGDIDVLVTSDRLPQDYQTRIKEWFKPQATHANGHTFSFDWKGFQVDFCKIPSASFEVADFFFSYNDLGGLLGVMARRLGLKFGFDGLHFTVHDEFKQGHDFLLTTNPRDICQILDVSYNRWQQGFYDYEELFDYVTSSKYFNAEFYQFENRNAESRERDSKRKTYMEFLEWLKVHHTFAWKPTTTYKDMLHNKLFAAYPETKAAYLKWVEDEKFRKAFAAKFSGDVVMKVTELQPGVELGEFMKYLRPLLTREFKETVVSGSVNVDDWVLYQWKQFNA